MKSSVPLTLLVAGVLVAGCAHPRRPVIRVAPATPARQPAAVVTEPIVTPDTSLVARVVAYNATGRFVVLGFPGAQMPAVNQSLFLYRNGLKVGELKVTGPRNENNIVADLVNGTAEAGDEVRDQ